jgi:hypothetical protein
VRPPELRVLAALCRDDASWLMLMRLAETYEELAKTAGLLHVTHLDCSPWSCYA